MEVMALEYRVERDAMGEVRVPGWALWGAETQRAVENFPVSGERLPREFIRALGLVKKAAAESNAELGLLDPALARLIAEAAEEVARGLHDEHFPVDVFQTGSGTSSNMNANEVIANLANERAGTGRGARHPVHPNDHVNLGQSSNDVIPTCIHLSLLQVMTSELIPALEGLSEALRSQASLMAEVVKVGRTHLMDALPVTLGQEFGAYARQVELGKERVLATFPQLSELPLGGTAVGSRLGAHPRFAELAVGRLAEWTGLPLREAEDHFEAGSSRDACVQASGAMRTVALSLYKIANDLRWMASGPRAGLGEITLPPLQPGSSMMPGKVNPVIPEVVLQVVAEVIGSDATVAWCGAMGNFELNVGMPVLGTRLLRSAHLLARAARLLAEKAVRGVRADRERCLAEAESSPALLTVLRPLIGHDAAADLAREVEATGRTVREVVRARGLLGEEELERLLDLLSLARGRTPGLEMGFRPDVI